jgi:hypothetical protein
MPAALVDVPEDGRHIDISADEATRAAIAKLAGLVALPRLEASFDLTRHGRDGLHAVGQVVATVVQSCVVSLEPVEEQVEEAVDLSFTSEAETGDLPKSASQPVEAHDPPELLRNGVVDLGAVATEFLVLGINPYPRKDGVVFEAPAAGDPGHRPFAALAALKKGESSK